MSMLLRAFQCSPKCFAFPREILHSLHELFLRVNATFLWERKTFSERIIVSINNSKTTLIHLLINCSFESDLFNEYADPVHKSSLNRFLRNRIYIFEKQYVKRVVAKSTRVT